MVDAVVEKRSTGAEDVVWDLSIFYSGVDDPAFQRDMDSLNEDVNKFAAAYRGRVAKLDVEEMLTLLHDLESIHDRLGRITSFAGLLYSTNTNEPAYGALLQKATEYSSQLYQNLVFFELEWNQADDDAVRAILNHPALGKYRHLLEAELRYKPYRLSEPEEKLLTEKAVTGRNAWVRFFSQLIGALRLDFQGEKQTLPQVLPILHDANRDTRREAADAITAGLKSRSMELSYIFNVLAADKASDDKLRRYPSWVSSRNLSNKAPDAVVEALIDAVTSSYNLVARHYTLKRRLLGYDELTDYDRYAPLPLKEGETFYRWDEAQDIVLKAFHAFSPRFEEIARRFFDENWIHAPVTEGKRGGAFCDGTVPSAHPYILMNYTGKADDVMTLAHELGHGIHEYLAAPEQGMLLMYTPLTTAEMASTFGEMLVFSDLMSAEPDPEARLAMLSQKIEGIFATVFRQIAMNRFEDGLHNARRTEGELTTERISQIWIETQRAMFQDSVNLRDDYSLWWSYVPHFLQTPGYVYAYAFGELLVLALFNIYKERGAAFVPQFIDVLAAGDSDWPEQILAKAGIDLTDLNFWKNGLEAIQTLIDQEEQLAKELYPEKFA